jgi:hypothetical protein
MKKPKIKLIKSKMKVRELNPLPQKQVEQIIINKSAPAPATIESKTQSSALPLLKQAPIVREIKPQAQRPTERKDEERIFVSYERNQMSAAEKRRVYSFDIRGGQAARQTGTIEPGRIPENVIGGHVNPNEIHLERAGERRAAGQISEALAVRKAQEEYSQGAAVKYKSRREPDFY